MVVDINIKQLGVLATELSDLLNECDEAQLNVFNQLKDSCVNWQDGYSVVFEEKVRDEKTQTQTFFAALQKNKNVFDKIYEEYKSIGNKLYANLKKKDEIMGAIDECIEKANEVISDLNGADRGFYYPELSTIDGQKSVIQDAKNKLSEMKKEYNELFNKIEKAEERIGTTVSKLEDIKMNKFSFSFQ